MSLFGHEKAAFSFWKQRRSHMITLIKLINYMSGWVLHEQSNNDQRMHGIINDFGVPLFLVYGSAKFLSNSLVLLVKLSRQLYHWMINLNSQV